MIDNVNSWANLFFKAESGYYEETAENEKRPYQVEARRDPINQVKPVNIKPFKFSSRKKWCDR